MQAKGNPATGIRVRHSEFCPARSGGECTKGKKGGCRLIYRARVYDRHAQEKLERSFPTLAAAKAWRAERIASQDKGHRIGHTKMTLNDAAEAWLAAAKASPPTALTKSGRPYKPSVLRGWEADLRNVILPNLGARKLADIGRGDLKRLVDRLIGSGLSPSRVRNVINPLRAIYREAIEAEEIEVNPTTSLRLPAVPVGVTRAAEPTDVTTFLALLTDADRALFSTAFFAGARLGELRALRWDQIELREGSGPMAGWITIEHGWDERVGQISTKSARGTRRVPIVRPYLSAELEAHRERTRRSGRDFVFGSAADRPFTPSNLRRRVYAVIAEVNEKRTEQGQEPLRRIGFHDGRHTFGALCRAARIPEPDIADYLGHSREGITARYTSPIEIEGRALDNMTLLAKFLGRGDTGARIAQLDQAPFAGTPDEFERMIAGLREDYARGRVEQSEDEGA